MATRRPKVPRADALGRPSGPAAPGQSPRKGSPAPESARQGTAGGDLIEAEFGGARGKAAGSAEAKPSPRTEAHGKAGGTRRPGAPRTPVRPRVTTETQASDPVPAKAFSGRVLALAVVMIAITIMLAPTVKIFLEKRSEISALEAEIASKEAEQADLNKQLSRWQDPNYVKQQARDRINMVMPGETGYWVFGGDEAAGTPGGRTGSGSSANPANLPWVDALWESIRRSATD
ncbi:MAG TPA: septum formation initiator family protein [Paenarthrobacter sp.]|nr:septum formation initiator family protein [Paenarthrobacter sp.]